MRQPPARPTRSTPVRLWSIVLGCLILGVWLGLQQGAPDGRSSDAERGAPQHLEALDEGGGDRVMDPRRAMQAAPRQVADGFGDDVSAACQTTHPWIVTAVHVRGVTAASHADAPAVLAYRDTGNDRDAGPIVLATQSQVGAVYGLAFDAANGHLYAAAYLKVGLGFGPGGPGAIYRIDLADGSVSTFATLEVGPDRHADALGTDPAADDAVAAEHVATSGISDIDIDPTSRRLFAMNLTLGRIDVLDLADGTIVDRIPHAAAREPWFEQARPFGLAVREGALYQGIVDSQVDETGFVPRLFAGRVYRSGLDGDDPEVIVTIPLQYDRGARWQRWRSDPSDALGDEPLLSDIAFRPDIPPLDGDPIVALRDRRVDVDPTCVLNPGCASGRSLGDLVATVRDDDVFRPLLPRSVYDDRNAEGVDATWGGIATLPGLDLVVAPAGPLREQDQLALGSTSGVWYNTADGRILRTRLMLDVTQLDGIDPGYIGVGDTEVLCAPAGRADPDVIASATREAGAILTATATVAAAATGTSAAQTAIVRPTSVAATQTAHAPTLEARATVARHTATALAPTLQAAAPTRTAAVPLREASATAAANAAATFAPTAARHLEEWRETVPTRPPATATSLAWDWQNILRTCGSDNPYVVTTCFVPSSDLNGNVRSPDWLADRVMVVAFNDSDPEDPTTHVPLAWQNEVGAVLGEAHDIPRQQLYVGAYTKRLAEFGPLGPGGIYRIDMNTMQVEPFAVLDAGNDPHQVGRSFDESAAQHVGRLGLGDLELAPELDELFAMDMYNRLIWRISIPDGEVLGAIPHGAVGESWAADARPFGLGWDDGWLYHAVVDSRETDPRDTRFLTAYIYRSRADGSELHESARLRLDYSGRPAWEPWELEHDDDGRRTSPMLADIEFRGDGDLVLGIRERRGDTGVLVSSGGDMVLAMQVAERWIPLPEPEFYDDNIRHNESSWGSLATLPWLDQTLTTAIDPQVIYSGGAAWYDNVTGDYVRTETIYEGRNTTFGKASGLGDVEHLCEPPPPTPTPTATVPSATPSPTATITPTATPTEYRIYLPMTERYLCEPESIRTDAVLVLDMSTSMGRETTTGIVKRDAAVRAAKAFVSEMQLTPDEAGNADRVGIVGFNEFAWTAIELSSDGPAIERAIESLPDGVRHGTRIDLALLEGQQVLDSSPRQGDNVPTLILLTDGLPNRVPTPTAGGSQEDTVLARAAEAKASGTRIFTIGLGLEDDVLDRLLTGVASAPDDYYFSPDGEDLAAIYRQIAGRIVECP